MTKTIEDKIQMLEAERTSLFEKRKPIDDRILTNYEEIKALKEDLGKLKVQEMKDENFIPTYGNWFSDKEMNLILGGDLGSMPLYYHADNLIHDRFQEAFGRYGVTPETKQTLFKILLVKGDAERTAFVRDIILYMLPHLAWCTKNCYDNDLRFKEKRFNIYEHTLSAGGRYYLVYTGDDMWSIHSGYHHKVPYKSLDEALAYIENHLWYERKDEESYEDEDDDY